MSLTKKTIIKTVGTIVLVSVLVVVIAFGGSLSRKPKYFYLHEGFFDTLYCVDGYVYYPFQRSLVAARNRGGGLVNCPEEPPAADATFMERMFGKD
jgi:hypothetical protein